MTATVHPTAIIADGARLDEGVEIGPYAIIGGEVHLEEGVQVAAHATVQGRTRVGAKTRVFSYAMVGMEPHDMKYAGEESSLEIGRGCLIREWSSVEVGTDGGGMVTRLCDHVLLMRSGHIGHDSQIGNRVVLGACSGTAGHVTVGDRVVISSLSALHQKIRIGEGAFVGLSSAIAGDVPPYSLIEHGQWIGSNLIGMRRQGLDNTKIREFSEIALQFYVELRRLPIAERVATLRRNHSEIGVEAIAFLDFVEQHDTRRALIDPSDTLIAKRSRS